MTLITRNVALIACAIVLAFAIACDRDGTAENSNTIFVSGRIEGDETNVAPKLSGRIVEVTVREGDRVAAGQVMVRLSGKQTLAAREEAEARVTASQRRLEQAQRQVQVLEAKLLQIQLQEEQAGIDAQGRVSQAEGQLAAAEAELTRAMADLEQNRIDAKRYAELAQRGAVPKQQAEQVATKAKTSQALVEAARKQVAAAEGALTIARASLTNPRIRAAETASLRREIDQAGSAVRLARAEVEVSKAALGKAEADVEDLSVTAPFDGLMITRSAEPGQVVSPGSTLLTMVDPRSLYLRGFVPEGQIGHVEVGQRAEVYLDSKPETPIPAEVMRVDPEAMFTPENTYFQQDRVKQVVGVKLLLLGGYGNAKLGMPADARIFLDHPQGNQ